MIHDRVLFLQLFNRLLARSTQNKLNNILKAKRSCPILMLICTMVNKPLRRDYVLYYTQRTRLIKGYYCHMHFDVIAWALYNKTIIL